MAIRSQSVRLRVQEILREAPFRPFILCMENGDRVAVEHPENIAFFPGDENADTGPDDFYVTTGRMWYYGTFDAVTSIARDRDGRSNGDEEASV
ncbi:MAG: hypothetical protein KY476_15495 [Planctomycetes bacterium]|nr:hypothetical protein [Planctomycetota bacterium]